MSRLTEFHDGIWGLSVDAVREGYDRYSVFSRLAAYEDIGLEPKQVRKIANVLQEIGQEYNCRFEFVAEVVEKYAKYVDAERDGRLVVLPCKVGDVLYVLTSDSLIGIEETKCKRITIKTLQDGSVAKIIAPCVLDDWGGAFRELYLQDFGKTVFLTRAEAEEAMKGDSQ